MVVMRARMTQIHTQYSQLRVALVGWWNLASNTGDFRLSTDRRGVVGYGRSKVGADNLDNYNRKRAHWLNTRDPSVRRATRTSGNPPENILEIWCPSNWGAKRARACVWTRIKEAQLIRFWIFDKRQTLDSGHAMSTTSGSRNRSKTPKTSCDRDRSETPCDWLSCARAWPKYTQIRKNLFARWADGILQCDWSREIKIIFSHHGAEMRARWISTVYKYCSSTCII